MECICAALSSARRSYRLANTRAGVAKSKNAAEMRMRRASHALNAEAEKICIFKDEMERVAAKFTNGEIQEVVARIHLRQLLLEVDSSSEQIILLRQQITDCSVEVSKFNRIICQLGRLSTENSVGSTVAPVYQLDNSDVKALSATAFRRANRADDLDTLLCVAVDGLSESLDDVDLCQEGDVAGRPNMESRLDDIISSSYATTLPVVPSVHSRTSGADLLTVATVSV